MKIPVLVTVNAEAVVEEEVVEKPKSSTKDYVVAVGRRRESAAQVRLHEKDSLEWKGKELKRGDVYVNGVIISDYFHGEAAKVRYLEPLRTTPIQ